MGGRPFSVPDFAHTTGTRGPDLLVLRPFEPRDVPTIVAASTEKQNPPRRTLATGEG